MSETTFIAFISAGPALIGALIGGAATAAATFLQQKAESRRHLLDMAVKLQESHLNAVTAVLSTGAAEVRVDNPVKGVVDILWMLQQPPRNMSLRRAEGISW